MGKKIFYKYLTESRIDVLRNSSIRYAQPQFLNDPFECMVYLNRLTKSAALTEIQKKIVSVYETFSDEQKKTIGIPIEELVSIGAKIFHKNMDQSFDILERWLSKINTEVGILSLSITNNNLAMWSHYANNHKGFVIGFEFPSWYFSYHSQYGNLRRVYYSSKVPKIKIGSTYCNMFFTKSLDWSYEHEWRIVRLLRECKKIGKKGDNEDIYVYEFPANYVKEIYLGANMSNDTKEMILKLRKDKYPGVSLYENYIDRNRDTYGICSKLCD